LISMVTYVAGVVHRIGHLAVGRGAVPATPWATPGILEAMKPGRMQGHGGTEEVPR
jgi:hypothetical protein